MPFSLSRRSGVILLVIVTFVVVALLTHRNPGSASISLETPTVTPGSEAFQSPTIAVDTPTVLSTSVTSPVVKAEVSVTSTPTDVADGSKLNVATDADVIDLKKLRSTKVNVQVHKIEQGENYWTLAKKANIDILSLIGANPTLPFKAIYHKTINIMSVKGVLHTVKSSESLSKIAEKYRTTEDVIKEANGLHWWHPARTGDVLFIPGVKPVLMTEEWKSYSSKRGMFGVPFSRWASWTSGFGLRVDPFTGKHKEHTGVDLRAKYGDPVYASAPGKVIFTGVAGGYGNLIQIAHGKGYVTYYGHLSKIYTHVGDRVKRGSLIGRVGATGRVTGPHLHFEIRLKGKPLDPLQFI